MAIENLIRPKRQGNYRADLPPPFYSAKDEISRIQYPPEGKLQSQISEDTGNYGTGGYYGNTYRQEFNHDQSYGQHTVSGRADSYRHLGDRRWDEEPGWAWEREHTSRHGYRPMEERKATHVDHRGKGPRSYRRADERILEDLNDRLYDDPYLDASNIETAVREGDITLTGIVEDRQAKRRAEDLAESISGVRNVENRLRVAH